MSARNFNEFVSAKWDEQKFLCVGLDPDFSKLPEHLKSLPIGEAFSIFGKGIVDATKDIVCAFKPNPAFYEAHGVEGWQSLKDTIDYIHSVAPQVPVILDAKRGDIGNTNEGYAKMAFDILQADAVTLHPYQGGDALEPFFARKDKGLFILVRTSNPGSREFQDLKIEGETLYKYVARTVASTWNKNGNCGIVVGATYPEELREIRSIANDLPILIPGTGAQGGDLEASVKAGKNSKGQGMIINASRAVLYAASGTDFAEAARKSALELHGAIQKYL